MKASCVLALLLAWLCWIPPANAQYSNSLKSLLPGSDNDDPEMRCEAVKSLVRSDSACRVAAMPELTKLCRDIDVNVRFTAATNLREFGKPAVPLLIELLRDRHQIVRVGAIQSLGACDDAKDAIPSLVNFLFDDDEETRQAANEALQSMAAAAAPYCSKRLTDPNAKVRKAAADALCSFGEEAKSATAALIGVLRDSDSAVRAASASALAAIGPSAKAAVPALKTMVRDSNDDVRRAAVSALSSLARTARRRSSICSRTRTRTFANWRLSASGHIRGSKNREPLRY